MWVMLLGSRDQAYITRGNRCTYQLCTNKSEGGDRCSLHYRCEGGCGAMVTEYGSYCTSQCEIAYAKLSGRPVPDRTKDGEWDTLELRIFKTLVNHGYIQSSSSSHKSECMFTIGKEIFNWKIKEEEKKSRIKRK